MPDLHPYFKDVSEAFEWYPKIEKQLVGAAEEVKRHFHIVAEVASIKCWEEYQKNIIEIAKRAGHEILVIINEDNKDRYWIINVDYKIIDKLQQSREIGCIQIDVDNARRLGIKYVDKNNKDVYPIIIHSAVPGGIERYIYMLFDNFEDSFPIWLFPIQVRLVPVSENFVPLCEKLIQGRKDLPIRFDIDDRAESVSKKIKQAHDDLIPYVVVIGEKEAEAGSPVLEDALEKVVSGSKGKPFIEAEFPKHLSMQLK